MPAKPQQRLLRNTVKDKLGRGELVLSLTVRLVRTVEISALASTAGFDSIYIDLEHSTFSLDATSQICMSALALNIAPFVRVPNVDYVARVLDGGALGIIAPHIESSEDAERIVRAAKFPPLGHRSFSAALPHFQYQSVDAGEMFSALDDATMVIAMVESAKGLEAVDRIAAVPGVDVVFIGTNDLCASLGVPGQLDHPLVRDAYAYAMQACQRHGKSLGIGGLAGSPALLARYVALGAQYVSTGTDLSFLLGAATAKARQLRELPTPPVPQAGGSTR
ncbi:aldolase [Pseudorhodoferax sp. Leaf267]|nr:aldolase [Pseudorhodoferax sp. Leaf267]